jgi:hypothetical protein
LAPYFTTDRTIGFTMLITLGTLSSAQAQGMYKPSLNSSITVQPTPMPPSDMQPVAGGMILHIYSNASYLSQAKAHSHAGGTFFNDAIHVHCSIIIHAVVSSATEAQLGALFYNGKDGIWLL